MCNAHDLVVIANALGFDLYYPRAMLPLVFVLDRSEAAMATGT
jgi:hypothetical protein